jgi:hypothetical protein
MGEQPPSDFATISDTFPSPSKRTSWKCRRLVSPAAISFDEMLANVGIVADSERNPLALIARAQDKVLVLSGGW